MNKNLVSLLLMIVLLIISSGCTSIEKPASVVSNFLGSMQKGELDTAKEYIQADASNGETPLTFEDEEQEKIIKAILSRITFEEPKEISAEKEQAIVRVKITSPDLMRIVSQAMSELMPLAFAQALSSEIATKEAPEAMMEHYLMNSIADPNGPLTSTETEITLKKVDNKWLIVGDDDLLNALTGNIGKAFN